MCWNLPASLGSLDTLVKRVSSNRIQIPRSPDFSTGQTLSVSHKNMLFGLVSNPLSTTKVISQQIEPTSMHRIRRCEQIGCFLRPTWRLPWEGPLSRGTALHARSTNRGPSIRKPSTTDPPKVCHRQHDPGPQLFPIVRQNRRVSLWTGLSQQDRAPRKFHTRGREPFFPLQATAGLAFLG